MLKILNRSLSLKILQTLSIISIITLLQTFNIISLILGMCKGDYVIQIQALKNLVWSGDRKLDFCRLSSQKKTSAVRVSDYCPTTACLRRKTKLVPENWSDEEK